MGNLGDKVEISLSKKTSCNINVTSRDPNEVLNIEGTLLGTIKN